MVRIKKTGKESELKRKARREYLQGGPKGEEDKNVKRRRKEEKSSTDVAVGKKRKGAGVVQGGSGTVDAGTVKQRKVETAQEAKVLWEKLRNKKNLEKGGENSLVAQLIKLLEGDLPGYALRHDTSRIIQWTLKSGSKDQRREVMQDLIPHIVSLSGERYGRHVVLSALVAGRATRAETLAMFDKFRGNVQTMSKSVFSSEVLDCFYQTAANSAQKKALCIELLHGKEAKLLNVLRQRKSKASTLQQAVEEAGTEFGSLITDAAKATLTSLAEKETSVKQAIVHDALLDFLQYSTEKNKPASKEIATLYAPLAVHLVHTRSGAVSVVNLIKLLDAKSRKKLVKSLASEVMKVAQDDHGHIVIMALYEHVDDTKLLQKIVLTEHLGKTREETLKAINDKYASLPLLNLLAPHQTRYFHPERYSFIWTGETTSLKDEPVRRKELLDFALPLMLETLEANTEQVLKSVAGSKILLEIILLDSEAVSMEKKTKLVQNIVDCLKTVASQDEEKDAPENGGNAPNEEDLLENAQAMRTLKYLVSLSNEKAYSFGSMLSSSLKGNLNRLRRGKGDLILTQMSKMSAPFSDEAKAALAH